MVHAYTRHAVNLDLSCYTTYLRLAVDKALADGGSLSSFEKAFARFIGAPNCLAVSSARGGFLAVLRALGIGPNREVIMPAYTFPSMPAAVVATGARPVFVDADPVTCNIDPALAEKAVTERTAAIVAAHLFGRAADIERLADTASRAGASLIEDCAHSAGALKSGKRLGSFGDAAVFSFGIGKNMPCFGGGAIAFKDRELAGKVRRIINSCPSPDDRDLHLKVLSTFPAWLATRRHIAPFTTCVAARILNMAGSDLMDRSVREPIETSARMSAGAMGRMANLQAAVGLEQLERLPRRNATLARNGRYLAEALRGIDGVTPPEVVENEEHIYLYFRILVPETTRFRSLLLKRGVDTQADDMANCAGLDAFRKFAADCPVAASLPPRSIELPNNSSLNKGDLDYIASAVRAVADAIRTSPSTEHPG